MEWIVGFVRAAPEEIRAAGWVPAVLQVERRVDPFTQQERDMPIWRPVASTGRSQQGAPLAVRPLTTDVLSSADARKWAESLGGVLHSGMLVELWIVLIGEAAGLAAWKPSYLLPVHEDRSLFLFPPSAVRRLLSEDPSAVARRWAETAYFSNFHASAACDAAHDMLVEIVAACAGGEGDLYAISDGYTSA